MENHINIIPTSRVNGEYSSNFNEGANEQKPFKMDSLLGFVKPYWIPDDESGSCMYCDQKFTLVKRRHHCRACGKILCSNCCNKRLILPSMDYKTSRVCVACYSLLENDENFMKLNVNSFFEKFNENENVENLPTPKTAHIPPDPSKPEQYCSKISPLMQVTNKGNIMPVVYVPAVNRQGILKNNGSRLSIGTIHHTNNISSAPINSDQSNKHSNYDISHYENNQSVPLNYNNDLTNLSSTPSKSNFNQIDFTKKQVMFSDGVRPGGDLSLLDDNMIKPSPSKNKFRNRNIGMKETSNKFLIMAAIHHIPPLILKFPNSPFLHADKTNYTCFKADDYFNNQSNVSNNPFIDLYPLTSNKLIICANLYLHVSFFINKNLNTLQFDDQTLPASSKQSTQNLLCFKTSGMVNVGQSEIFSILDLNNEAKELETNSNNEDPNQVLNNDIHIVNGLWIKYQEMIKDYAFQMYHIYVNAIKGKGIKELDFIPFVPFKPNKPKPTTTNQGASLDGPSPSTSNAIPPPLEPDLISHPTNLLLSNASLFSGLMLCQPVFTSQIEDSHSAASFAKRLIFPTLDRQNLHPAKTKNSTKSGKSSFLAKKQPHSPFYLNAVCVHKWETPWARLLPLRLLLRLGYQSKSYPYPVISNMERKSTFYEINHTIINLLADCRNFKYSLPRMPGLYISYSNKVATLTLVRSEIKEMAPELSISDHVLALASNFNPAAGAHLICVQNETDCSYKREIYSPIPTKQDLNCDKDLTNINLDPIGATFIVFNGSLKQEPLTFTQPNENSNKEKSLSFKQPYHERIRISLVEDGIIVHVTPQDLALIASSLKEMKDLTIGGSTHSIGNSQENIFLKNQASNGIDGDLNHKNEPFLLNNLIKEPIMQRSDPEISANIMQQKQDHSPPPNTWSFDEEYQFEAENSFLPPTNAATFNITADLFLTPNVNKGIIYENHNDSNNALSTPHESIKHDENTNVSNQSIININVKQSFNVEALAETINDLYDSAYPTSSQISKSHLINDANNTNNKTYSNDNLSQESNILPYKKSIDNLPINSKPTLVIKWVNEKPDNFGSTGNIRPCSLIDGLDLHNALNFKPMGFFLDYIKRHLYIRLVEIYYLKMDAILMAKNDSLDADKLAQDLSKAFCHCIVNRLELLSSDNIKQINLRITLDSKKVGYELSPLGQKYQPYLTEIDDYLIPIIHSALNYTSDMGSLVLELVFHILKI